MNEVSCRVFSIYQKAAEQHGIRLEDLVQGLPVSLDHLLDPRQRLDWDLWVQICERFEELAGGPEASIATGRQSLQTPDGQVFRSMLARLAPPDVPYQAALRWLLPVACPHIHHKMERLGPNKLGITCTLSNVYRGGAAWFRVGQGAFQVMPRLLNLPDAVVEAEIGSHGAFYTVFLPPSRTFFHHASQLFKTLISPGWALSEFAKVDDYLLNTFAALARSHREFRAVLDRIPEGIVIHRNGQVIYLNAALGADLAQSTSALLRRNFLDLVHPDDREIAADILRYEPRSRIFLERKPLLRALRPNQQIVEFEVSAPQIIDFDGETAALLALRNVTEQRYLQAQLSARDRMASIGMLAAGVAHEINNPLTYVLVNIDLLARELSELAKHSDPAGPVAELVELADDAVVGATRVRDIVRDLKVLARPDEHLANALNLHAVLDSAIAMAELEVRHRGRIVKEYGDVTPVQASEARLCQVFLNLLVNAAHALPDTFSPEHLIKVRTRMADGRVLVDVNDNGGGIPPERLSRIFEPFYTTKPVGQGTGLGLSICQTIVTELGGVITVESRVGVGSTFCVALPAAECLKHSAPAPAIAGDLGELRLLIVDDDPAVATAIARMLEGHLVTTVSSGREGLQAIGGRTCFDVILCDLMMPDLSGPDVYQAICQEFPELSSRVVFITAGAVAERARALLATTTNPVIEKPISPDALLTALRRVIPRPSQIRLRQTA